MVKLFIKHLRHVGMCEKMQLPEEKMRLAMLNNLKRSGISVGIGIQRDYVYFTLQYGW